MIKNKQNPQIHNAITMTEADFMAMASAAPAAARVEPVAGPGGGIAWRLFGTHGVYQDAVGNIDFVDRAELHALLHRCGFTRFHEDGQLKLFPEDANYLL